MKEKNRTIYFLSDAHLGLPDYKRSREREILLVKWLDEIKMDADEVFLLGDIFDFWYEWKRVIPKGFSRLLGKICELTDSGITVHFFTGNHDIWAYTYFAEETGMIIHREPYEFICNGRKFHVAHGDGLGPGDSGFKFLKKIFTNKFAQFLFSRLHPNFALALGNKWSVSRKYSQRKTVSLGENELLVKYSRSVLKNNEVNYFLYGHRHIAECIQLSESAVYMNIGDWLSQFTYAVFKGNELKLIEYQTKNELN